MRAVEMQNDMRTKRCCARRDAADGSRGASSLHHHDLFSRGLLHSINVNHSTNNVVFRVMPNALSLKADARLTTKFAADSPSLGQRLPKSPQAVLDRICVRLKKHKYLFIKAQKPKAKSDFCSSSEASVSLFSDANFEDLTVESFRSICCLSKESSLCFQQYLEKCASEVLGAVKRLLLHDLDFLIKHEYGCYVMQRILHRDLGLLAEIEPYCMEQFLALATNEFSSRVLQVLIRHSREFRVFTLKSLKEHLDLCFNNISVVFILAAAIESAANVAEFDFVRSLLLSDAQAYMSSKYFKRILVVFLENTRAEDLDLMFEDLRVSSGVLNFLTEKYYTYILLALLKRNHKRSVKLVLGSLKRELPALMHTKYFKFLVLSLLESEDRALLQKLHSAFESVPRSEVDRLKKEEPDYFLFYAYCSISSAIEQPHAIDACIKNLDHSFGLLAFLGMA